MQFNPLKETHQKAPRKCRVKENTSGTFTDIIYETVRKTRTELEFSLPLTHPPDSGRERVRERDLHRVPTNLSRHIACRTRQDHSTASGVASTTTGRGLGCLAMPFHMSTSVIFTQRDASKSI